MGQGLKLTDFDSLFSARGRFWEESRRRALAEKEQGKCREEREDSSGPSRVIPLESFRFAGSG